jgi:lysophospholipase L1-like esterase
MVSSTSPSVRAELSQDSLRDFQASSNEQSFQRRMIASPDALIGIAEGDSWFDYAPAFLENPLLGDLINQLNKSGQFNILRVAIAGDTLENMTYGSSSKPSQLENTLSLIQEYQPAFFLFSAGGNDIAGSDGLKFEPFLNHGKSKLGVLRKEYLNYFVNEVCSEMFEYLIERVIATKPDIKIFLHGYGYPIPDGRPVIRLKDYNFIGPWFQPPLIRKNLTINDGQEIINELIDALNNLLKQIAIKYSQNVVHIDLRTIINESVKEAGDYKKVWANELHLTADGYKTVAKEFTRKIQAAFT